jgi:hypothetical protein
MAAQRKSIDCRDYPSEKNCSLRISGTEEEVLDAAVQRCSMPPPCTPRYDLTLVAGELLKAERGTVTAATQENLSSRASFVGQTLPGSTRYIFWGALALVVIVLLAIMSRFLPKAQQ